MGQCAKCRGWKPDNCNAGYSNQVCAACQRQDSLIAAQRRAILESTPEGRAQLAKERRRQLFFAIIALLLVSGLFAGKFILDNIDNILNIILYAVNSLTAALFSFLKTAFGGFIVVGITALLLNLIHKPSLRLIIRKSFFGSRVGSLLGLFFILIFVKLFIPIIYKYTLADFITNPKQFGFIDALVGFLSMFIIVWLISNLTYLLIISFLVGNKKFKKSNQDSKLIDSN
jgi:hypothetical protein